MSGVSLHLVPVSTIRPSTFIGKDLIGATIVSSSVYACALSDNIAMLNTAVSPDSSIGARDRDRDHPIEHRLIIPDGPVLTQAAIDPTCLEE